MVGLTYRAHLGHKRMIDTGLPAEQASLRALKGDAGAVLKETDCRFAPRPFALPRCII